jgi:nitroimidazol reductase NimA-like FMN-containing flavoprotein (pyridoxamine 5'-phosphate oxidase superfamily)
VSEPAPEAPLRELVAIDEQECRDLLGSRPVGRIVFVDARGPIALPVNHVVDGDTIVFRTAAWSSVLASKYASRVGFEVDDFDEDDRRGWSVLVTGKVTQVEDPDELRRLETLGVTPWSEGPRTSYMKLQIRSITGRRLVPDQDPPQ